MNLDLSHEQHLKAQVDFSGWRFVRQILWEESHAPSTRCLPSAVVVEWTLDKTQRAQRSLRRQDPRIDYRVFAGAKGRGEQEVALPVVLD